MRALISACLALPLISCAGKPVVTTELVKLNPPAELLAPSPQPTLQGDTYRAVIGHALDLKKALHQCNADKAALREWADGPAP